MFVTQSIGENTAYIREYKIYGGAADIVNGALVEPGAAVASLGAATISADPPTNVLGILTQLHDYSVVGDWTYTAITSNKNAVGDVDMRPFAIVRSEVAVCATQAITVAASAGAGATEVGLGTSAGADDEIGAAWMYNAATDELRYVEDHDGAATAVFSNDIGTAEWAAVKCTIVPPIFFGTASSTGLDLNATLDQVILEGNGTGAWCNVIGTYIETVDGKLDPLDPAVHSNGTYADAKFYVDIVITKHALNIT
jgi:hypothetical protein